MLLLTVVLAVDVFGLMVDQSIIVVYVDNVEHIFRFNQMERLKVRIKDNPQPNDFVELYFTETLLQLIVTETKRYESNMLI